MKLKYIFGPVLSRRLGRSLGIDLIPFKTCQLDCIYCECGKTNNLTTERKEYQAVEKIITELDGYLKNKPELDYITFAGSGEPTLYSKIQDIIVHIKENYPEYKIALITNGVVFQDESVIEEVKNVDLIIPSLDAISRNIFKKINRPADGLMIEDIIQGLLNLRREFDGELWLEIFIVPGVNDTREELALFKEVLNQLKVDKVQLNRLDRPGTEDWIKTVESEKMREIAEFLTANNNIKIEII